MQSVLLLLVVLHQVSSAFHYLKKKDFSRKFSFFNGFTQTPHPRTNQNLLSMTKVFVDAPLKLLKDLFRGSSTDFLNEFNNLLYMNQFGFHNFHSTDHALILIF